MKTFYLIFIVNIGLIVFSLNVGCDTTNSDSGNIDSIFVYDTITQIDTVSPGMTITKDWFLGEWHSSIIDMNESQERMIYWNVGESFITEKIYSYDDVSFLDGHVVFNGFPIETNSHQIYHMYGTMLKYGNYLSSYITIGNSVSAEGTFFHYREGEWLRFARL